MHQLLHTVWQVGFALMNMTLTPWEILKSTKTSGTIVCSAVLQNLSFYHNVPLGQIGTLIITAYGTCLVHSKRLSVCPMLSPVMIRVSLWN